MISKRPKIKSAKGTKCLIMGSSSGTYIRIYDKRDKSKFVDYDIAHYDFEVEILDDDAYFWESKDSNRLDYSPQTLGLGKNPK